MCGLIVQFYLIKKSHLNKSATRFFKCVLSFKCDGSSCILLLIITEYCKQFTIATNSIRILEKLLTVLLVGGTVD